MDESLTVTMTLRLSRDRQRRVRQLAKKSRVGDAAWIRAAIDFALDKKLTIGPVTGRSR